MSSSREVARVQDGKVMGARKDKSGKTSGTGGSVWLLTFNDMMTLLLTFFVLIFSMSGTDLAKVEAVSSAVGIAFGASGVDEKTAVRVFDPFILSAESFPAGGGKKADPGTAEDGYDLFLRKRNDFISRFNGRNAAAARATTNGVRISLGGDALFQEGSAELGEAGRADLASICSLLEGTRPSVKIEVMTGEAPADRARYATGWELAAARGAAAARYLTSRGAEPGRISVSGYGVAKPFAAMKSGRGGSIHVTLTFNER